MGILLTDKEIGVILRECDYSMCPARIEHEEPDEHKEIARAQLKKVVKLLEIGGLCSREDAEDSCSECDEIWQDLLKECE